MTNNSNENKSSISRRNFLQGGAILGAALGLSSLTAGKATEDIAKAVGVKEVDSFPYEIADDYKRYAESRLTFYRNDSEMQKLLEGLPGLWGVIDDSKPGYTTLDYQFMMGAWATDFDFASKAFDWNIKKPAEHKYEFASKEDATKAIKKAAKFYGASLVGITPYDNKWVYDPCFSMVDNSDLYEKDMPFKPKSVIVMALEMDYEGIATAPSTLEDAATGLRYSNMLEITYKLSTFINGLGYGAFACGNDTAMSVPYAIAAGLGEQGRQGLLITYEYGPRVRLCKVFTEMEFNYDKPVKFGANDFCKVCKKCAYSCPSQSISTDDEMTWEGVGYKTISNQTGVKKYYVNVDTCWQYWSTVGNDCGVCIASCPFNKPDFWHHRITTALTGTPLKPFLNEMDDLFGYGNVFDEQACFDFWDLDTYIK